MPAKKHFVVYRDNIASINANYLRTKFGIKASQCDNFRRCIINFLEEELKDIVIKYYELKDINILNNYIDINGVSEEYFKKEPTKRLIIEIILQNNLPQQHFVLADDAILLLARILFRQMLIISQDF